MILHKPVFKFHVSLQIRNSHIGNNVTIGAYECVKDQDVSDNSIVLGESSNLIIKAKNEKFSNNTGSGRK